MSTITGVLQKAYKKKGGFFSICVDDNWYGTEREDYTELEGQTVTFESYKNKRGYLDVKGKVKAAGGGGSGGGAASGPRNNDARQSSIVMQSSFKTATELVGHLLANDCIVLPAKKADRYDAMLAIVDETALGIYNKCLDPTDFLAADDPAPSEDYVPHEA